MPEKIELNIINNFESDCEKVKFLADEYLHGELLQEDKDFIETHITECIDCFDFIEEEKKYIEEIKLAEYIPEISVSESVMAQIIENKMIIDRPPRKRFVPVGFISAAAVIIIMFVISKGNLLNIFTKSNQDNIDMNNIANDSGYIGQKEQALMFDEAEVAFGTYAGDAGGIAEAQDEANDDAIEIAEEEADENYIVGDFDNEGLMLRDMPQDEPEQVAAMMAADESVPDGESGYDTFNMEIEMEIADEEIEDIIIEPMTNNIPPAPAITIEEATIAAAAGEAPVATGEYKMPGNISVEEFLEANADLSIKSIYMINYIDDINFIIYKDIDLFRTDYYANNYRVIESKYTDILENNLRDNNIFFDLILREPDDGYIGIIYYID